jgi:hypothetical protein
METNAIAHFLKMSAGFVLPAMCLTGYSLVLNHLQMEFFCNSMCQAALEVMLCDHHAGFIVVVKKSRVVNISKSKARIISTPTNIPEVHDLFDIAQVAQISASQELREVRSWRLLSRPRGTMFLKMIPPLILLNLNRGRRVPSATALPIWKP